MQSYIRPVVKRHALLAIMGTLSAGEMVAAFAAENGLATLVGTRTGGQVLGGSNFAVGGGFVLRLPAAAWYMWSGAAVEGVGVSPRVHVPMDVEAQRAGADGPLRVAINAVAALRTSQ